jgi:hypothetical protein
VSVVHNVYIVAIACHGFAQAGTGRLHKCVGELK